MTKPEIAHSNLCMLIYTNKENILYCYLYLHHLYQTHSFQDGNQHHFYASKTNKHTTFF